MHKSPSGAGRGARARLKLRRAFELLQLLCVCGCAPRRLWHCLELVRARTSSRELVLDELEALTSSGHFWPTGTGSPACRRPTNPYPAGRKAPLRANAGPAPPPRPPPRARPCERRRPARPPNGPPARSRLGSGTGGGAVIEGEAAGPTHGETRIGEGSDRWPGRTREGPARPGRRLRSSNRERLGTDRDAAE